MKSDQDRASYNNEELRTQQKTNMRAALGRMQAQLFDILAQANSNTDLALMLLR
jgi:16S rRNA G966 N2-methylase RsmD